MKSNVYRGHCRLPRGVYALEQMLHDKTKRQGFPALRGESWYNLRPHLNYINFLSTFLRHAFFRPRMSQNWPLLALRLRRRWRSLQRSADLWLDVGGKRAKTKKGENRERKIGREEDRWEKREGRGNLLNDLTAHGSIDIPAGKHSI